MRLESTIAIVYPLRHMLLSIGLDVYRGVKSDRHFRLDKRNNRVLHQDGGKLSKYGFPITILKCLNFFNPIQSVNV